MFTLKQSFKEYIKQKIRYAICIALLLNCWNMRTYQAMWAIHTLFCLLVLLILFKKRKPIICMILSAIVSTSIVTFGSVNMYTIHQTSYNLTTTKKSLQQRSVLFRMFTIPMRIIQKD